MLHHWGSLNFLLCFIFGFQLKTFFDTVCLFVVSAEESTLGNGQILTQEKVLEIIESAYPNPITIKDVAK